MEVGVYTRRVKSCAERKAKQRAGCKFKLLALLQPYSISANNLNYKLNTSQTIFSERELLQSISASTFRLPGLRLSPGVPLGRAAGPRSASAPRCCRRGSCGSRVSWGMSKLSLKQQWTQNLFWLKPAQVSLSYSTLHCSLVWVQLSCLFCWQHWKHGGSAAPRELHVQRRMYSLNPSKHDNCSEEGMIIGINPLKSFYSGWMPLLS